MGLLVPELAQTGYVARNPHEQARLGKTVVSNFTFDGGSLFPPTLNRSMSSRMGAKLEIGSSGWIRTSNPPVNSRMLCR